MCVCASNENGSLWDSPLLQGGGAPHRAQRALLVSYYIIKKLKKYAWGPVASKAQRMLLSYYILNGSSRDIATILEYTNVTGPNLSGSSWDRAYIL